MASVSTPIILSIQNSRFSSLYLSPSKISKNHVMFKSLPQSSLVSRASSCLAFSPLPEKKNELFGLDQKLRLRGRVEFFIPAAAAADGAEIELSTGITEPSKSFAQKYPWLITGFFFFAWYFLNVIFNILNKQVYNYFPYSFFVSVVHLLVGVVYCLISWSVGLPKRALWNHFQCRRFSVCFGAPNSFIPLAIVDACRYWCINGVIDRTFFQLAGFW